MKMSQIFDIERGLIPVTIIEAGPVRVLGVKTLETDGYDAVVCGFSKKKNNKPQKMAWKKALNEEVSFGFVREFRVNNIEDYKVGDVILADSFEKGTKINVQGISKGKGFQGGVKRWGFGGHPKSHGTKHALREPGSIGSTGPAKVLKGLRMAGRMGGDTVKVLNLEVVATDKEQNLLLVKGAVPGVKGGYLKIETVK